MFFVLISMIVVSCLCGKTKPQICDLQIPDFPLSKEGLMTTYKYINCKMSVQPSFVQATIFDKDTETFYIYHPLVSDIDKEPIIQPVEVILPTNYEIGIWFGSNADNLRLINTYGIANGNCINGLGSSIFGQFAHCNAVKFFDTLNTFNTSIPPLGIAKDGNPCPTVRDYSVVDADPNDNLQTQYILTSTGRTAQDNPENRNQLGIDNIRILKNPSDNALLTEWIYPAIGCNAFRAFDLSSGIMHASLALNELQAIQQVEPIALIPSLNPMTLVNGKPNLQKLNLYRLGVNQPVVMTMEDASSVIFCTEMVTSGLDRIQTLLPYLETFASPNPQVSANLYLFLMYRLNISYNLLTCRELLNKPIPILYELSDNNIVIRAIRTKF